MMKNIYETDIFVSMPDMSMHPGGLRLTDRAARLAGLGAGMQVADIGCGLGVTASFMSSKYGIDMIGLEKSEALVEAGLKRHPGLRLICWDCVELPFEDRCLDAVYIECALSVIGHTESIFSECARTLKQSGALIISDVVLKQVPIGGEDQILSTDRLFNLLSTSGFDVIVSEDHTPALRTYFAQLREHGGPDFDVSTFLCASCFGTRPRLSNFGYTLIIARKS